MSAISFTTWYFEPTREELDSLQSLNDFGKALMSKAVHILRLGVHLHKLETKIDVTAVDISTEPGKKCQKYITRALKVWTDKDKFFPLRLTAPSILHITTYLPRYDQASAVTIFKLCVLRTFGVGSMTTINKLKKVLDEFDPTNSEVKEIEQVIQEQGKGVDKISRPVYGQLQIVRGHVSNMLKKFWGFALDVREKDGSTPSFEDVYDLLCDADIPTVRRYGLLAWLITSDLSEWKICKEPTIGLLTDHLGVSAYQSSVKRGGPTGPNKALKRVAEDYKKALENDGANLVEPDLGAGLVKVWRLMEHPPSIASWLEDVAEECRMAQGRPLSVADMEHILCKIERYAGRS